MKIHMGPVEKLVFYARNPRKNDKAVDRMASSLKTFAHERTQEVWDAAA